jgi:hypothetical protein
MNIGTLHLRARAGAQMPQYQCHKKVWALKIADIVLESDGIAIIIPSGEDFGPFTVDEEYMRKHSPQPGGYYVVSADGHKSWSSAEAFENGYTLL